MPKTKPLRKHTTNGKNGPTSVISTAKWRETVPLHLQKPLGKALTAMENNDLANALKYFGECAELEPFSKPVLYFGAQTASQAFFSLRGRDPNNPNLTEWRRIAEDLTKAAYEIAPEDAVACHNVGRFLQDAGDDEQAISYYRHSLMLDSKQVETWGNLGTALYQTGDVSTAWECWERCISLPAPMASGRLSQSYIWLRKGDYLNGWKAFGDRWKDLVFQREYGRQNDLGPDHWLGGQLPRKHRLLVHGEQGLGDHVQFARYIPVLLEQGYNVVGLETRPPLKRWMESAFPDLPIFARDSGPLPGFTHHVSTMDLPAILGTTVETIPPPVAPMCGIRPHPLTLEDAESSPLRVGLVWEGAKGNPADSLRSIPAEELRHLAGIPNVRWVSLQFSPDAFMTASAWLGSGVVDGTIDCADTHDTASIMRGLDLIICVDTLTAHLAGTLGLETWVLHRFCREWRWLDQGEDSPWYPSIRNFTQSQPGDWHELLSRVRRELESRAIAHAHP